LAILYFSNSKAVIALSYGFKIVCAVLLSPACPSNGEILLSPPNTYSSNSTLGSGIGAGVVGVGVGGVVGVVDD